MPVVRAKLQIVLKSAPPLDLSDSFLTYLVQAVLAEYLADDAIEHS